jgi:hypothetical protein
LFLKGAVKPLKAAALNPAGSLLHPAAEEVKSCSHTDHERRVEPGQRLGHERFLFGRAETHPNNVRPSLCHECAQFLFFLIVQGPEGWGVGPHHRKFRIPLEQRRGQPVSHARRAAIEEVSPFRLLGDTADFEQEIGTINAAHLPMPVPMAHPNHGHAVGRIQERAVENRAESLVFLRLGNTVDPRHANVSLAPRLNGLPKCRDGQGQVYWTYPHSQNIDPVAHGILGLFNHQVPGGCSAER